MPGALSFYVGFQDLPIKEYIYYLIIAYSLIPKVNFSLLSMRVSEKWLRGANRSLPADRNACVG